MRELAIAFSLGMAFSAPPGIVTAEAIRRGITGGFVSAVMVGIGSLIGDAVYAALALGGLSALSGYPVARSGVGICGALLLFWLAYDALRAQVPTANPSPKRSDFIVGAALSLTNPWAIAFWLGFGGVLLSAGIRNPEAKLPLLLATFLTGALAWSLILSLMIALAKRFVNATLFRIVSIGSALVFIGTGLYTIWQVYLDLRRG
ncbi:MAG: LysE family translocator [Acidobacteriia bacterium]|nr:LysE family translocator [Terriglobia bacterium]